MLPWKMRLLGAYEAKGMESNQIELRKGIRTEYQLTEGRFLYNAKEHIKEHPKSSNKFNNMDSIKSLITKMFKYQSCM